MSNELSQRLKHLKSALHIANEHLMELMKQRPEELLNLFEDVQDPTNSRDRFVFISNSLLSLSTNLSEARLVLVNLGQYNTIEKWTSHEKKKTAKLFAENEENSQGENPQGEEGV